MHTRRDTRCLSIALTSVRVASQSSVTCWKRLILRGPKALIAASQPSIARDTAAGSRASPPLQPDPWQERGSLRPESYKRGKLVTPRERFARHRLAGSAGRADDKDVHAFCSLV